MCITGDRRAPTMGTSGDHGDRWEPTGPHGPRGGQAKINRNLTKINKNENLSHRSSWSPWWAGSPTGPRGPRGGQNDKQKLNQKSEEKKINTLLTSPRGPRGGQALPLVLVVPVVGRISQKKMKLNI
jgi:hypothetical protein